MKRKWYVVHIVSRSSLVRILFDVSGCGGLTTAVLCCCSCFPIRIRLFPLVVCSLSLSLSHITNNLVYFSVIRMFSFLCVTFLLFFPVIFFLHLLPVSRFDVDYFLSLQHTRTHELERR